jgi:peroxiredoxin Q/BCP
MGDRVPDFSLLDQTSTTVTRDTLLARGPLVLYFYPKDDTTGCRKEACSFRDAFEAFSDLGASVVGVSSDDPASHAHFAEKHRLPFTLLSDPGGTLRKHFGVPKTWGFIPGRVTYIIDRDGVIRYVFSSMFAPEKHITEALRILRAL